MIIEYKEDSVSCDFIFVLSNELKFLLYSRGFPREYNHFNELYKENKKLHNYRSLIDFS